MSKKAQLFCVWCGIIFLVLFTLGWWLIAGYIPPISPALSANEVAAFYQQNTGIVRFGLLITLFSSAFNAPWVAVIATQLKRIEGEFPALTYTLLISGTIGTIVLFIPPMVWTTAAFRPDRDAELIMLLSDFGWLFFIMTFPPFFIQSLAIGLAVFSDKSESLVFPRWVGYFNIWVGILFIPGGLITFFKTGPFAWDGIFAFWLPLTVFFMWYLVMFPVLIKAIKQQSLTNLPKV